jgi:hypothetical protein
LTSRVSTARIHTQLSMKNKSLTLYALHIPIMFLLIALGLVGLFAINNNEAGVVGSEKQMRIEEGTTYTDTFTKGDNTIVVTKTYRLDGVYINTKTYDSSGALINEKTQVNPLKDHVVVYSSTTTSEPAQPVDTAPVVSDPVPPVAVEPEKIVEVITPPIIPLAETDFEEMESELVSEIQDLELIANDLPELVEEKPANIIQRVVNVVRNFFKRLF